MRDAALLDTDRHDHSLWDVAIIGGGIAGLATAARLQARGLSTIVFEAHGQPGGCAGFYRRRGFSFDVGATTLVDFEPGGVGGELLDSIHMPPLDSEVLPGYMAWLPDRTLTLHRDRRRWSQERACKLGDSPEHHRFWQLLDRLADTFWQASRRGVRLPLRRAADVLRAVRAVGPTKLPLVRYLNWTLRDALRAHRLDQNRPLVGLLAMLVEDTLHSSIDHAPLINSALGISIRGAGLSRARGGMRGFWKNFLKHYRSLGGTMYLGCPVVRVTGSEGQFTLTTRRGVYAARQVVSALPIELTRRLAPPQVARGLQRLVDRDKDARGGAVVVCLGVPDEEVSQQHYTHHQLLQSYTAPLGSGNNMFISVSAASDTESAPDGFRSVMISTHCELTPWHSGSPPQYVRAKRAIGERLISLARRVYPRLGEHAVVMEVGTPRTYQRFTGRPEGAVGGIRQTLANSNQNAVPYESGMPGFWLAGDSTWPGLGTVACVLGSRMVAESVIRRARRTHRRPEVMGPPAGSREDTDDACSPGSRAGRLRAAT